MSENALRLLKAGCLGAVASAAVKMAAAMVAAQEETVVVMVRPLVYL
tara:strand:- start:836 stop:976 length:141 start_codon:yes stop_codon:yes gene_type:complete